MSVCVCARVYVCVFQFVYVSMHVSVSVCMYVCMRPKGPTVAFIPGCSQGRRAKENFSACGKQPNWSAVSLTELHKQTHTHTYTYIQTLIYSTYMCTHSSEQQTHRNLYHGQIDRVGE